MHRHDWSRTHRWNPYPWSHHVRTQDLRGQFSGRETLVDLPVDTAKAVSVTEAARSGELVIVTIPMKSLRMLTWIIRRGFR